MFEPVHGSAPTIAGKNIANPIGAISTASMMLEHLGLAKEAAAIDAAILEAVRQKKTTFDVGSQYTFNGTFSRNSATGFSHSDGLLIYADGKKVGSE